MKATVEHLFNLHPFISATINSLLSTEVGGNEHDYLKRTQTPPQSGVQVFSELHPNPWSPQEASTPPVSHTPAFRKALETPRCQQLRRRYLLLYVADSRLLNKRLSLYFSIAFLWLPFFTSSLPSSFRTLALSISPAEGTRHKFREEKTMDQGLR